MRAEVEQADQTRLSNFALRILEKCWMVEVGMGGRLDATNVVPQADEAIAVSAFTAVDLDHQAFLGDMQWRVY